MARGSSAVNREAMAEAISRLYATNGPYSDAEGIRVWVGASAHAHVHGEAARVHTFASGKGPVRLGPTHSRVGLFTAEKLRCRPSNCLVASIQRWGEKDQHEGMNELQ